MLIDPTTSGYATPLFGKGGLSANPAAGSQKSEAASKADENINRIKEVGFREWFEEQNERKIEEMRKEILQSMGLTEEGLQNLPANQRANIERMIQDEIQKKLAASSEMNGQQANATGGLAGDAMGAMKANNISSRLGLDLLDQGTQLFAQQSDDNGTAVTGQNNNRNEDEAKGIFG